jgi:hypothetical protein
MGPGSVRAGGWRPPAVPAAVPGCVGVGPGRRSCHACHARPPPSRDPEWFVRLSWRIGLVRSFWGDWVGVPKQGLFAAGSRSAMWFGGALWLGPACRDAICAVCGFLPPRLPGRWRHRACSMWSNGRDPVRKTADLAYNGRNSPARRELKLFRDVYGVDPILREGPILRAIGTGGAGGIKMRPYGRQLSPEPGSCGTPASVDG